MKNIQQKINNNYDVAIIGSGMASLTAACLCAKAGQTVIVIEKNYLLGGCVSSYYRKGFIFEAGATTLVGLDDKMPLNYLLKEIEYQIPSLKLKMPMTVHLKNGKTLHRFQDLEQWIEEAERIFGKKNQRAFWKYCYKVSQFVWETSLKQRLFPPSQWKDFIALLKNFEWKQLKFGKTAFTSMQALLKRFDLLDNQAFVQFINEQLLITAQNTIEEVNVLFGATALCYTNYGNYYVEGGLINLVKPLCQYIESKGGEVLTRIGVDTVGQIDNNYIIQISKKGKNIGTIKSKYVISGIPINNTLEIFNNPFLNKKYAKKVLSSEKLVSAFSMGIGFNSTKKFNCIHHQIHLEKPLPFCHSNSIFISLNHPSDIFRTPNTGQYVANISTHIHHPKENYSFDKTVVEEKIIKILEKHQFLKQEDIVYQHSSTPSSWETWTYRKYGFVGGYPQYFKIKPWQMIDARLDGKGAYICGDTTYPGQGIPGTVLSGIIAFEKMKKDGCFLK